MFKVDLKTKEITISKDELPSVEELMPNPGFRLILKKKNPVKTF
jgi:hypothetical protein